MPQKPFEAWICDTCGEQMTAEEGWLEWLDPPDGRPHEFRICHNKERCMKHYPDPDTSDGHLHEFLGAKGFAYFLSFLDHGPIVDGDDSRPPKLPEMRSFTEAFRRLLLPYYEEARPYHAEARAEGDFAGFDGLTVSLPSTSKDIIERYGRR